MTSIADICWPTPISAAGTLQGRGFCGGFEDLPDSVEGEGRHFGGLRHPPGEVGFLTEHVCITGKFCLA
jgi:hypothetical protein